MKNKQKSSDLHRVRAHLTSLKLERPMAKFWLERYRFNRSKLGLDEPKAILYADRTLTAFRTADRALVAIG